MAARAASLPTVWCARQAMAGTTPRMMGCMRIVLGAVALCLPTLMMPPPAAAQASHSVHGYVKKGGTYVAPHHATNPDHTKRNNFSTKGNVNPYSGKPGNQAP